MAKNIREIVAEWLKANGYNGLAGDGCGCEVDDLMVCDDGAGGGPSPSCVAGHKINCPCPKVDTEDGCEYEDTNHHWCMAEGKIASAIEKIASACGDQTQKEEVVSSECEKLAKMMGRCLIRVRDKGASRAELVAAIQAAIREELLTDKTLVLHAEEILELQQKVEALEKQVADLSAIHDCTGYSHNRHKESEASHE